jgi:hypothetical protein
MSVYSVAFGFASNEQALRRKSISTIQAKVNKNNSMIKPLFLAFYQELQEINQNLRMHKQLRASLNCLCRY